MTTITHAHFPIYPLSNLFIIYTTQQETCEYKIPMLINEFFFLYLIIFTEKKHIILSFSRSRALSLSLPLYCTFTVTGFSFPYQKEHQMRFPLIVTQKSYFYIDRVRVCPVLTQKFHCCQWSFLIEITRSPTVDSNWCGSTFSEPHVHIRKANTQPSNEENYTIYDDVLSIIMVLCVCVYLPDWTPQGWSECGMEKRHKSFMNAGATKLYWFTVSYVYGISFGERIFDFQCSHARESLITSSDDNIAGICEWILWLYVCVGFVLYCSTYHTIQISHVSIICSSFTANYYLSLCVCVCMFLDRVFSVIICFC